MGVLYGKTSNTMTDEHRMDLKKGTVDERKELLEFFDINDVEHLDDVECIKQIKQVELYTKWRKHVPDQYKSPLYDHPGDDVLASVKDDRKSKKEYVATWHLSQQKVNNIADAAGILVARKSPVKSRATATKKKASQKAAFTAKAAPTQPTKRGRPAKGKSTASKKQK